MLKRIATIFSVLVIFLVSGIQSIQTANAAGDVIDKIRPGTSHIECKVLQKSDPPISILIKRDLKSLCAREVKVCHDKELECKQCDEPLDPEKDITKVPIKAFSGSGNQFCEEAFAEYVNSPSCFTYTSGGRTFYIPRG